MLKNSKINSFDDSYVIENLTLTIDNAYIYFISNYNIKEDENNKFLSFINSMSTEFKLKLAKVIYGSLLWFYTEISEIEMEKILDDNEVSHNIVNCDHKKNHPLESDKIKSIVFKIEEEGYIKEAEDTLSILSKNIEDSFKLKFLPFYEKWGIKEKIKFLSKMVKYPILKEYLFIKNEQFKEMLLNAPNILINNIKNNDEIISSSEIVLSLFNILKVVDSEHVLLTRFINTIDDVCTENFKEDVVFKKKYDTFAFFMSTVCFLKNLEIDDEKKSIFKNICKSIVQKNNLNNLLSDIIEIDSLEKNIVKINILPFHVLLYGWDSSMSEILDINISERLIDLKRKIAGKAIRLYSLSLIFEESCLDALSEHFNVKILDHRGIKSFDCSLNSVFVLENLSQNDFNSVLEWSDKVYNAITVCKPKELKPFLSKELESILIEKEKEEMKKMVLHKSSKRKTNKF